MVRPGFDSWVGKIPWRRKWQSTPALLPGKSHGRRSLTGYSPGGCKESDTTEQINFHFQSFPASGPCPMSWLFASGGQSVGASASALVLPMSIQSWFPLGWTSLISLLSKGLSKVFSTTTVQKHQFFGALPSLWSSSHIYTWLLERPHPWLYRPLSARWCLCFLLVWFAIPSANGSHIVITLSYDPSVLAGPAQHGS